MKIQLKKPGHSYKFGINEFILYFKNTIDLPHTVKKELYTFIPI